LEVLISTLSEVKQEAEIALTNDELQPLFEAAYQKYQPKVELRGFRKGKVPIAMVKKLYGEAIEHDSLDDVATASYRKAMEEKDIHPLGQPSMVDMDFKRGQHFRFKVQYEIKPAIELKKYKHLVVEKPVHTVTEAEIDAEIEHLRRANSTTEEVSSVNGPDHIVIGDVQELDETGSPLIGKKTADTKFYLSDEKLAQEIRDALSRAETGKTYRVTFPSAHEDHAHPVHIAVTVKKAEKVNLPVFDDAFVKKISEGKVTTKDEFLSNLRADIGKYWEEQSERKLADGLVAEVVKAHAFAVPETLVNNFLDAFVNDLKSRSRDRKLPKDFDEKKFREDGRAYAISQAKWMLLKERIAEIEHITVSDGEIEQLAAAEATRIGIDKARLLEYYKSSAAATERLLSEKIIAFLKQNAKITEKTVDERPARLTTV
jgi:trigger factor